MNLVSAWLLHPTEHSHEHGASHHHHDHNLRGAYLHVLADALTSVLAIAALLAGSFYGWTWLDPAVGLVGAIVIGRWSIGLMRDSGAVLLDASSAHLSGEVRAAVETHGDRVLDLHVWRVGPGHHAAILSVLTERPCTSGDYKARLLHLPALCHLTVEVHDAERIIYMRDTMTPLYEPYAAVGRVLADYFDGLYNSDADLLAKVFHPRAHYVSTTGGELLYRTMEEYLPIVRERPSPSSRGERRADRILSIGFAGPVTAFARVECAIGAKAFTDLLTLIFIDGRWQIISKVFHSDLRTDVPQPDKA